MKGLSITDFDKDYSSQCVSHWYGSKARRIFKKSKRSTKHGKQRRSNDQILKLITWTVILPMFLRVTKNDFIVSRFLKAINKLKYNSSVFSFYSSVCVLLLSFTVRKIFTFLFWQILLFVLFLFSYTYLSTYIIHYIILSHLFRTGVHAHAPTHAKKCLDVW